MEVSITRFRRELFDLVNQAMNGADVWVSHKGRRFKLEPEKQGSKLSRLTTTNYLINQAVPEDALRKEMTEAWTRDWDSL